MRFFSVLFIIGVLGCFATTGYGASVEETWPMWRGPDANGVSEGGDPPTTWSETENIKWKVAVPYSGDCTPIIWGDKIFLQEAVPDPVPGLSLARQPKLERESAAKGRPTFEILRVSGATGKYRFNLVCLDRATGKRLWERTVAETVPHEGHHAKASLTSYSPVTDGSYVWVNFGSRGVYCFDVDGTPIWSAKTDPMEILFTFGEGSSPTLAGDALIVVADQEGQSKIYAFDKVTGDVLWEKDRDEGTTWSTPLAVKVGDAYQVIVSGEGFIRSYDVATGEVVWKCSGLSVNAIPMPVVRGNRVYCMTGHKGYVLLVIELGHAGDLTGTDAIAWELNRGTPQVASPLLYKDHLYFTRNVGSELSCYKVETGEAVFVEERLKGLREIYASPVGAAGRIYITGREGVTKVLKYSERFEVIATNQLDDSGFGASPVIIGDELYLKGDRYLYCITKP